MTVEVGFIQSRAAMLIAERVVVGKRDIIESRRRDGNLPIFNDMGKKQGWPK
jgi:hypothetical protein